jgi:alginate O-acetyltransferase complex protein AlgI
LALYWLQPALPIRNLDFWLPTTSLGLVLLGWGVTRPKEVPLVKTDLLAGLVMLGVALLVGLLRYVDPLCCITPTRPPVAAEVAAALLAVGLLAWLAARFAPSQRVALSLAIVLVLVLFLVLKTDALSLAASQLLRQLAGQKVELAKAGDLGWLGFSYIAFRLIHTLRERQTGRLPVLPLAEYAGYVLFFPALTAGPIDRVERFIKDWRNPPADRLAGLADGGRRILVGLFRKFVVADLLALVALSQVNFAQVSSTGWMWLLLYAYAFRIYFDFSGYTDIAIGLGRLMGFKLPENFDNPYLKPNLTAFWNSWHITLAQWFRAYYFNPLTRALRSRPKSWPLWTIILVGQLSTFALIGLWHGVTWNFLIWGAWHGVGLFIHNRWLEFSRQRLALAGRPAWLKTGLVWLGVFLTFNYVALGWVWFALPSPVQSWQVLLRLFGLSS